MDKIIVSGFVGVVIGFMGSQLLAPPADHDHNDDHHSISEPSADHATDMVAHPHAMTAVADNTVPPALTVEATKDAKDGYNIKIETENYTFSPEAVNGANVQNEGHAHIYVNDKKIARLYSNWFHLSNSLLDDGENEIRITLNANDHSEWSIENEPIDATVTVTK